MSTLVLGDTLNPTRLVGPRRDDAFVAVTSEHVALFGREGGAFEIWTWPLKIAHDWSTRLFDPETGEPLPRPAERRDERSETAVTPSELDFAETFGAFRLHQAIFAARSEPALVFLFQVSGPRPVELEVSFACDLRPMWPAGLGGQIFGRDEETGGFIATEELGRFATWIGAPGARLVEPVRRSRPTEHVRFRLALAPGAEPAPFFVSAARAPHEPLPRQALVGRGERVTGSERATRVVDRARRLAQSLTTRVYELRDEARAHWSSYLAHTTSLECSNVALERAFVWSKIAIERAWVDVDEVGRGVVAGFGTSGSDERPGRAWFFGADMLRAARALVRVGDAAGARAALEAVAAQQRPDGRLSSERSLAAGLCRWSEDYPYAHLSAAATLEFASTLFLYDRQTGDRATTRRLFGTVERLIAWTATCIDPDGLVRTERAGLGVVASVAERERISAEVTLQAAWTESLRAAVELAVELASDRAGREFAAFARRQLAAAEAGLATFWHDASERYEFAWLDTGLRTRSPSGYAALALCGDACPPERRAAHARQLNDPELATDWGLRGFAPSCEWFDAERDDLGAVSFELTAQAARVAYREGLAVAGEGLLRACLATFGYASRGAPPRALRGDRLRLASPEVACDVTAAAAWIEAVVSGVLGIEIDSLEEELAIQPAFPLPAERFRLDPVHVGELRARVVVEAEASTRSDALHTLAITTSAITSRAPLGRLGALLPPCSELVRVTDAHGAELSADVTPGPNGCVRVTISVSTPAARITFRAGPWVRLPGPLPQPGASSRAPRWSCEAPPREGSEPAGEAGVDWIFWGPPGETFEFPFESCFRARVTGAELVDDRLLRVAFPESPDALAHQRVSVRRA